MVSHNGTSTSIQIGSQALVSRVPGMGTEKDTWLSGYAPDENADGVSESEASCGSCGSQADSQIRDPLQHLEWATQLPPPLQSNTRLLSPKQTENLQHMASDPDSYQRSVMAKVEKWTKRKEELHKAHEHFRSTLDDTQRATLGKIDVFLLKELIEATGHTDTKYVEDLMVGFPVTGSISTGNLGTPIPGGQRVNAKPGLGGPKPLDRLKTQCKARNMATLEAAEARLHKHQTDQDLLQKSWDKLQQDISRGFVGQPQEISSVDLETQLLVDSFGVWEKHANEAWKVRVINNYKANHVNDFAWFPCRIRYNSFAELMEAAQVMKQGHTDGLLLGKADFRSAFKTLPTSLDQSWMNWGLVYNPEMERHQVVPLFTQTFGSLGAVMAWFRTAMLLQHVLENEFGLTTFVYVDDCFWVTRNLQEAGGPDAHWQLRTFEYIVTHLLGWGLDPEKSRVGQEITVLGLQIDMGPSISSWTLSPDKAVDWSRDILGFLEKGVLTPGDASKLCGRLQFLNSHVFGRVARALLRPLIWRQIQQRGSHKLTSRIRSSLEWFYRALRENWSRQVPYVQDMYEKVAVAYSDAESTGYIASVVIVQGVVFYAHARLPNSVRRKLKPRRTNILAYELVAAIMTILMLDGLVSTKVAVRHFVDNTAARSIIIKGSSKQVDLNDMVGMVWYTAAHRVKTYYNQWVCSESNLADKPSRQDTSVMKQLQGRVVEYRFNDFLCAVDGWSLKPHKAALITCR